MATSRASGHLATTIGANIRARREAAGLTQRALARRLVGVETTMTVSRWERGRHSPSGANLGALADALDCDIADFYANHEEAA